jgi:hypothetical protein
VDVTVAAIFALGAPALFVKHGAFGCDGAGVLGGARKLW